MGRMGRLGRRRHRTVLAFAAQRVQFCGAQEAGPGAAGVQRARLAKRRLAYVRAQADCRPERVSGGWKPTYRCIPVK